MINAFFRALAILIAVAIFGLAAYIALLGSPLLGGISIIFYRGLLVNGLLAILIIAMGLFRRRWRTEPIMILAAAAVSFSVNLSYLVIVPVTIDRSISVFLLSAIDDAPRPVDPIALQRLFIDRYVIDMKQIERRIEEQQSSGNIVLVDGEIMLTDRGRMFMQFARNQSRLIGTDPRFVGLAEPRDEAGRP